MPYIPRATSPTTGVPRELMNPPAKAHAPIPAPEPKTPEQKRKSLSLPKINPHTYEPDPKQVLKTLFGKEPNVDPYTGQLVLAPGNAPGPAVDRK